MAALGFDSTGLAADVQACGICNYEHRCHCPRLMAWCDRCDPAESGRITRDTLALLDEVGAGLGGETLSRSYRAELAVRARWLAKALREREAGVAL